MAFTLAGTKTFHSDTTSGSTIQIVPGATIAAGSLLVMGWAGALSALDVSSVADNSTQVGTANTYTARARLTPSTILRCGIIHCTKTTRAVLSTDTITITLNNNSSRRALVLMWWTPGNGNPVLGANTATLNSATSSPVATGGLVPNDTHSLVVCMQGWWNNASSAVSGFNSATPGSTLNVHSAASTTAIEVTMCYVTDVGSIATLFPSLAYTSITSGAAQALNFTDIASGTVFTKSITGAVSFAGSPSRPKASVAHFFRTPVLGFAGGEVAHPTARTVTGRFTPTGSVSRQATLARTLTAASLAFAGGVTTGTAWVRTLVAAALTLAGSQSRIKSVSKSVSGALTFSGAQTRIAQKRYTALLTPSGSVSEQQTLGRLLAAAFASFSGATTKRTQRILPGGLRNAGMVVTAQAANHFFAVFRPTGSTPTHSLPARTLFASIQVTSSVARFTTRQLVSSLIASGVFNTHYIPPVAPTPPGGGGFGALMSDQFFARYQVEGKWRNVKRVRVK